MTSKHWLTTLALAPALMALEPRADAVDFAPSEGSSLKKTFGIEFNLALGDLTILANGMDMSEGVPADFELSTELAMTVVDTYVDIEEEKPLDLIRLYDALSLTWETPDDSGESDEEFTALVRLIRTKFNVVAKGYQITFATTQLTAISTVRFLVAGQPASVPRGDGSCTDGPVSPDDYSDFAPL